MKRTMTILVTLLAVVALVSSFAMAGDESPAKNTPAKTASCGDKVADAKAVSADQAACAEKAACADKAACDAAMADMHKCCAESMAAGKGCCGLDAAALKASFEQKVAFHKAAAVVQADMHKCCAEALTAGKGCCGLDAAALKADFDQKVAKAEQKDDSSS